MTVHGASVVLGKNNSVVSRLKAKQPGFFCMLCTMVLHFLVGDSIHCIPKYVPETEKIFWWLHLNAKNDYLK